MKEVTLTKKVNYTKYGLTHLTVEDVIEIIRKGSIALIENEIGCKTLEQATCYIRSRHSSEWQELKKELLPAVAFNGTFSELDGKHLMSYSDVTALDFDHIQSDEQMQAVYERLKCIPCVLCVFVTPSGKGLKAIILHDNKDSERHVDLYNQLLSQFHEASSDVSCKDLARRNYLCYDPNIWVNPSPIPYHYEPTPIQYDCNTLVFKTSSGISSKSIICIMDKSWKKKHPEYWHEGNRANSIFKLACMLCKWGVEESLASEYFIKGWEDDTMTKKEIESNVERAYRCEDFGCVEFIVF